MKKSFLIILFMFLSLSFVIFTGCKDPEPPHEHTYSDSWTKDATHHWHAATCGHEVTEGKAAHSFGDWTTTKEPTEEAEGSRERTCSVCEYKATEVIAKLEHKHTYSEDWTKDATHHWHVSTCGHEVTDGKATHTFGEWQVTKQASCIENGERKATCTVCDFEKTEVSDKVAHSFGEYVSNNDATTEADGTKTRECSVCGYKDTVTDEGSKINGPKGFVFVKGGTVVGAKNSNNYTGVFIEGRTVTLSDFYMGKYEVTQEEYASVMEGQKVTVTGTDYALEINPSRCTADSTFYTVFNGDVQEKRPVEGVSWYEAVWYCNALSEKEGLTKAYNIEVTEVKQAKGKTEYYIYKANVTLNKNANGYCLPTEAEWEYAARGGDPTKDDWNYLFSGADTAAGVSFEATKHAGLERVGWYSYNNIIGITGDSEVTNNVSGRGTHQVGKKAPNRLGLYDMSGNVNEWCYDWYGTITTTTPADGASSGDWRILRGGSWDYYADAASVASRTLSYPGGHYCNFGFRVVRSAN